MRDIHLYDDICCDIFYPGGSLQISDSTVLLRRNPSQYFLDYNFHVKFTSYIQKRLSTFTHHRARMSNLLYILVLIFQEVIHLHILMIFPFLFLFYEISTILWNLKFVLSQLLTPEELFLILFSSLTVSHIVCLIAFPNNVGLKLAVVFPLRLWQYYVDVYSQTWISKIQ